MTPEDKKTALGEPMLVATTFVAGGGVVSPSAWTSRHRFGR